MTRRMITLVLVIGLVGSGAHGVDAKQSAPTMDVAGTYDSHGEVTVRVWKQQRRVGVRTVGLLGTGTVSCTNPVCFERGLDGTSIDMTRDLEIVVSFKGSDEELQAVTGRSRGNAIFTDGFESGDTAAVRGTASCAVQPGGGRVCDVELHLRGRLKGPDLLGFIDLAMTGELTVAGGTGTWGIIDWLGSLE